MDNPDMTMTSIFAEVNKMNGPRTNYVYPVN